MKLSHRFRQAIRLPAFWIAASLAAAGLVSNLASGQADDPATGNEILESEATQQEQPKLRREGTRIESPARCRRAGDRLIVELLEESTQLIALENLAAQRISKAVMEGTSDERWVVHGQITEFQGRNYILLDRVIRQAKKSLID